MNIFVSGGCKNGKSYYAQHSARALAGSGIPGKPPERPLYYIATMIPHDEEDQARIRRHLSEREGWGFQTIEQGRNLLEILERAKATATGDARSGEDAIDLSGVFLLDSVTAVLENEMYPVALKNRSEIVFLGEDMTAPERVKQDMVAFAGAIEDAGGSIVFVSDGIYGDMGEYSSSTENYRRALAGCDRAIAKVCNKVVEITYGIEEVWKENK
ncbi:MAG: bifunctional adenosylcobinamide kinase/adenosylcobinamide-phosphate guanylyltransferase [Eubacteriales bacterium]|nr:bifunctional adenosylcobinamide kinase/adenosylcobinamide-phosphate guanylyltransferase [Eubacteriales bacterium]